MLAAAGVLAVVAFSPRGLRAETTLAEANKLYESSRFDEAVEGYRALLQQDPDSATLDYNLGNAYFRLGTPGSLGKAIVFYERAFALTPRDPDVRNNLDFALKRAGEALIPPGLPPVLFVVFHLLSEAELASLHWLGFWLALLLGAAYLARDQSRERLRPWLAPVCAFWLGAAAWWGARAVTGIPSPGVTVAESEARSGPGDNFPVSFKVPEGRRVSRLETRGDWVEIGVLKEGVKGWVSAKSVEAI